MKGQIPRKRDLFLVRYNDDMKIKTLAAAVIVLIGVSLILRLDAPEPPDAGSQTENTATSSIAAEGGERKYALTEISSHKGAESCYTAIDGSVYDLTPWIDAHPGGAENILLLCGRDGTKEFSEQHGSNDKALERLAAFKIGTLE